MGADAAQVTMEAHLAELTRAREEAIASGQISAAVQAEHYRGKVAGLYEHKLALMVGVSAAALLKAIEELLGQETAEVIGVALGCNQQSV